MRPTSAALALLFIALAAASAVAGVSADDFEDRVKTALPHVACVRMINAKSSVGCSSPQGGIGGYVFHINSAASLSAYLKLDSNEWVVLLHPDFATDAVLSSIQTPVLAGAVLLDESVTSYSPDVKVPDNTGVEWNPNGSGTLMQRYEFPIVSVDGPTTAKLIAMAAANAAAGVDEFPKKALYFNYYMGPADLTSGSCLMKGQCDPMGGQSVWGTMGSLNTTKQMVFVAGKMDSNAMFHDYAFGAAAEASDAVVLMAAMEALSKVDTSSLPLSIGFGLFQAESWGSIGSKRFAAEVKSFVCGELQAAATSSTGFEFCKSPLRPDLSFTKLTTDSFKHVIAVDQSGVVDSKVYIHKNTAGAVPSAFFVHAANDTDLTAQDASTSSLPPTPVASFLQQFPGASGTVLSSYSATYADKFYHSRFDTKSNVNIDSVVSMATTLARSVYALAANDSTVTFPSELVASSLTVNTMLSCITEANDCALFASILNLPKSTLTAVYGSKPLSLYASVFSPPSVVGTGFVLRARLIEQVARSFLGKLAASEVADTCTSTLNCKEVNKKYECMHGKCVIPTVHFHESLPMDLTYNALRFTYTLTDALVDGTTSEPVWTEPKWSASVGVWEYTASNPSTDIVVLLLGIASLFVYAAVVIFAKKSLRSKFKII